MIKLFYGHFVDDTLVALKPEDLNYVHNALDNFNRDLKVSLNTFHDIVSHFLDIKIHSDSFGIYCKPTNIGHYTHYTSFPP